MLVLKGKRKKMIEGREKPIWEDVGFTVLVGEYEGKTRYSLIDERSGEKYYLFEMRSRNDGPSEFSGGVPTPSDNDVPF